MLLTTDPPGIIEIIHNLAKMYYGRLFGINEIMIIVLRLIARLDANSGFAFFVMPADF